MINVWRCYSIVLGAVSVGTIAWAIGRGILLHRRRLEFLSSAPALLRIEYTPEQWRSYLRRVGRRHALAATVFFALAIAFAFGVRAVWVLYIVGADSPLVDQLGRPGQLVLGSTLASIALTLITMLQDHTLVWALRPRGEVSLFAHCVLIEGKLIDWSRSDTRLLDARVSPNDHLLVLTVEEESESGTSTKLIELPLPPGCRPEPVLKELIRG